VTTTLAQALRAHDQAYTKANDASNAALNARESLIAVIRNWRDGIGPAPSPQAVAAQLARYEKLIHALGEAEAVLDEARCELLWALNYRRPIRVSFAGSLIDETLPDLARRGATVDL
jgi:hypothetical protein